MPTDPTLTTVDALAQSAFVVQGLLARRTGEQGASLIQARLLGILRDRRPTINQLAQLLELDKSSVSGLVDRAERRDLVRRVHSATDGRSVLVELTRAGRSVADQVAGRFQTDVSELLEPLSTAERGQLTELLSRVLIGHAAVHGIDLSTDGSL